MNKAQNKGIPSSKTTAIRLIAIRETSVSRLHEGHPKTLHTTQHYHIKAFKGSYNWVPIMPKYACFLLLEHPSSHNLGDDDGIT